MKISILTFFKCFYLFMAVLGLSCSMQDLLLQHAGFSSCGLWASL